MKFKRFTLLFLFLTFMLVATYGQQQEQDHASGISKPAGRDTFPAIAIKSNVLYDLTGTFSLGAEFRLGEKMSLDVPLNYNPFTFSDNRKWKHFLIQPELRLWVKETFSGHFFGLHAHYAYYNIGNLPKPFSQYMRSNRMQGWFAGTGVSYGYRWDFSHNWGLEATIGAGYAYMDYDKYPCVKCGDKTGSTTKHYFGPTKVGITLIYILGNKKPNTNNSIFNN